MWWKQILKTHQTLVGWPRGAGTARPTLAWLGLGFVPCRPLVSYCLWLPLVVDIMKICMDFGPYDAFLSSDINEMLNQQNLWNSLIISTYLLYLEWNVRMLVVNICILWYHEGGTYLLNVLQMLVRIFIQTSSIIQLSDQGYEIRVNLIPLSFDRVWLSSCLQILPFWS
jgi:hypothetical protein